MEGVKKERPKDIGRACRVNGHLIKRFGKPQKIRMNNAELIEEMARSWSQVH